MLAVEERKAKRKHKANTMKIIELTEKQTREMNNGTLRFERGETLRPFQCNAGRYVGFKNNTVWIYWGELDSQFEAMSEAFDQLTKKDEPAKPEVEAVPAGSAASDEPGCFSVSDQTLTYYVFGWEQEAEAFAEILDNGDGREFDLFQVDRVDDPEEIKRAEAEGMNLDECLPEMLERFDALEV